MRLHWHGGRCSLEAVALYPAMPALALYQQLGLRQALTSVLTEFGCAHLRHGFAQRLMWQGLLSCLRQALTSVLTG